jgi:hypothetical protein
MAEIIEKKESNSGKTVGIIEKSDNKFIGTVTYDDNAGDKDEDTQEFATLEDAQGWLELTFMFMMGVHADT